MGVGGFDEVGAEAEAIVEFAVRRFLYQMPRNNWYAVEDRFSLKDDNDCTEVVDEKCLVANILAGEGEISLLRIWLSTHDDTISFPSNTRQLAALAL